MNTHDERNDLFFSATTDIQLKEDLGPPFSMGATES